MIRRVRRIVELSACLCGGLLLPGYAGATSGVLNVAGSMTLTEDHQGVIVLHSDSWLNCDGHTITPQPGLTGCGESRNQSCGILALDAEGPEALNCRIQFFDIGVYAEATNRFTLRENTISDNIVGVKYLIGSSLVSRIGISSNRIEYNSQEGMDVDYLSSTHIRSNQLWHNGRDGIDFGQCSYNRVELNDFWSNEYNGLELDDSNSNQIWHNIFESNGFSSRDRRSGLSLDTSNNFDIWDNTMLTNSKDGVRIQASNNGIVEANNGSGNGNYDAYQSGSSGNNWLSNSWGSTYPAGLP